MRQVFLDVHFSSINLPRHCRNLSRIGYRNHAANDRPIDKYGLHSILTPRKQKIWISHKILLLTGKPTIALLVENLVVSPP